MPVTQFTDAVEIRGSQDVPQLLIQGSSDQNEPLQIWETNTGDTLAQLTGEGRCQIGSFDNGAMSTDDALIEVFRHEDGITLPKRGLNITGALTGALNNLVSWSVHELFLKGTASIQALHSTLRVRLVNQSTGTTNTGGELRAGDFEVTNEGGVSTDPVPVVVGLDVRLANEVDGHIDTAYGVRVAISDSNSNGIGEAYAIHATGGKTRLDEVVELRGNLEIAPSAENEVAKLYVKDDGKLYVRLGSGTEYLLSNALVPVSPGDDGKFLRSDGTWQEVGSSGTVESVGLSLPEEFTIAGSPVTTSGALTGAWASQGANHILASPTDSTGTPTFRGLVNADLPTVEPTHGGTGRTSLTTNNLLVGNGTGQVNLIAPGADGQYLRSNGTIFQSSAIPTDDLPDEVFNISASLTTTTATLTNLITRSVATNTAEMVWGQIMGTRNQFGSSLVARFHFIAKRQLTGDANVTVQILNQQHDSGGTPAVTIDASENSWRIRVNGVASQEWFWWGSISRHVLS